MTTPVKKKAERAATEPESTGYGSEEVAATNKIVRSGYRNMSIMNFPGMFGKMSVAMTQTDLFIACVPTPEAVAAEDMILQQLYNDVKNNTSPIARGLLEKKVKALKGMVEGVADFIEEKYPRNVTVAKMVGLEFANKAHGRKPAPTQKVTGISRVLSEKSVLITWKPLPKGHGAITYSLYVSLDGGVTFSLAGYSRDSRKGILFMTKSMVKYTFYLTASNSNGEGPASDNFSCVGQ